MSLWPLLEVHKVRPIAAADYFLTNPILSWFSRNIMHIIPIDRQRKDRSVDSLADSSAALANDNILLLFPEGSRGEPEKLSSFKSGIARLTERLPPIARPNSREPGNQRGKDKHGGQLSRPLVGQTHR